MHWLVVALLARQGRRAPCPMPRTRAGKRRTMLATWLVAVTIGVLLSPFVPTFAAAVVELTEDTELLLQDGVPQAEFGISVAITDDRAVVGAQQDGSSGGFPGPGAAYVFRDDGTAWVEEQKLTASDASLADFFGVSVAADGDRTVVGANGHGRLDDSNTPGDPSDDRFLNDSGAAYVFRRFGSTWVEEQRLVASDGDSFDRFGSSVAVAGDVAVVGAFGDDEARGAAYVFRYDGTFWIQEQKLVAVLNGMPDRGVSDSFGRAVAIDGDTILVGAYLDDTIDSGQPSGILNDHGSAYVFRFNGTTWNFEAKLLNPALSATAKRKRREAEFDFAGRSVAIAGDTALVGSFGDADQGANRAGSVRVFRYDGTTWVTSTFDDLLTATDRQQQDQFGISVAVGGNYAVIGAYQNDANGAASGSAYVFEFDATTMTWVEEEKLVASDGNAFDFAGLSVSVTVAGDRSVVGAPQHDDNGPNSGSAYVYTLPEPSMLALQLSALVALAGHARRARGRAVER